MSANDKLIFFFVFIGLVSTFIGILIIVIDKYKEKEKEKQDDELADEEEIKQKILQMHDYGEFLSKELTNKQNEAMLMYEMLLEKERKMSFYELDHKKQKQANSDSKNAVREDGKKTQDDRSFQKLNDHYLQPNMIATSMEEKNPFLFMEEEQPDSSNIRIRQLYNQGLSEADIAKKLRIGRGEVELVIRLYNKS